MGFNIEALRNRSGGYAEMHFYKDNQRDMNTHNSDPDVAVLRPLPKEESRKSHL